MDAIALVRVGGSSLRRPGGSKRVGRISAQKRPDKTKGLLFQITSLHPLFGSANRIRAQLPSRANQVKDAPPSGQ